MAMRAQISLLFKDKDLYDNFIMPNKTQKTLNDIIIKCLSAYYYDEEVRNKVEGISLEDIISGDTVVTDSQQICNSIREALAMQSFMASELENTLSDGIEDVTDIMNKVDNMAESTGFVKNTKTDYGAGIPLLALGNSNAPAEGSSHISQGDNGFFSFVMDKMMRSMFGDSGVEDLKREYENTIGGHTTENSPSQVSESQVVMENTTVIEEQPSNITEIKQPEPQITEKKVEEVEEEPEVAEDATDALLGLLGSL